MTDLGICLKFLLVPLELYALVFENYVVQSRKSLKNGLQIDARMMALSASPIGYSVRKVVSQSNGDLNVSL